MTLNEMNQTPSRRSSDFLFAFGLSATLTPKALKLAGFQALFFAICFYFQTMEPLIMLLT
jgi:hypothetical protein